MSSFKNPQSGFRAKFLPCAICALVILLISAFSYYFFSHINSTFAFTGPSTSVGIGGGAIGVDSSNNLSIGTSATQPDTKLLIVVSSTDASNFGFKILQPGQNPIFVVRNDGSIGIGTANPTSTLTVVGAVKSTNGGFIFPDATIQTTAYLGGSQAINASNITAGVFGAGNFAFPSSLGIATSTQVGLPQSLSIYGGGYFSGNVGIGTAGPNAKLSIGNNVATGFLDNYSEYQIMLYDAGTAAGSYGIGIKSGTMVFNAGAAAYSFDRSGNATTMTLDGSGNVGIGTTNPSNLLHVSGSNQGIRLTETGASKSWLLQNSGSDLLLTEVGSGNRVVFQAGGNVGIGMTAPSTKLEVAGNVSSTALCLGGTCNTTWPSGGGGGSISTSSAITAGYFPYWANTTGGLNGTSNIFQSGGNVGIGTAAPAGKLDVSSGGAGISAGDLVVDTANKTVYVGRQSGNIGDSSLFITRNRFGTKLLVVDTNNQISYFESGNVGIATTTPSFPLTVQGNAYVSGTLTAGSISGSYAGTVSAANVTAGVFGAGNFAFPSSLGIATSTQVGLPQSLSIYGGGFFSGNVGIGTAAPGQKLEVAGNVSSTGLCLGGTCNTTWPASGGGVTSVFARTGAVIATTGDYAVAQVTGAAPLASPTFTGIPAAPTAAGGTNTTQLATTAFVTTAVSGATITAGNVSSGSFGSNTGGGNYTFPASVNFAGSGIWNSSGNVGIGTAAPGAKLEVVGNTLLNANKLGFTNTGGIMFNGLSDWNWQLRTTSGWNYVWTGASSGERSWIFADKTNSTNDDTWTERFKVRMSDGQTYMAGNVGIGTAAPGAKLDIRPISFAGSQSGGIKLDTLTGNWPSGMYLRSDVGGTPRLALDIVSTEALSIVNGGNVGIGTASPLAKLHISGSSSGASNIRLTSTIVGGRSWELNPYAIGVSDTPFTIRDVTAGADRITIDSSGNVGIGTANPGARLQAIGADSLGTSFAFYAGGTTGTGLTMTNANNVGIGTTAPGTSLHVNLPTQTTATVNSLLISRWTRPQTGGVKWGNSMDMLLGSYGTSMNSQSRVDFKLADGGTDLPDTTVMTLQGNGNVGIGTSNPNRKLDVSESGDGIAFGRQSDNILSIQSYIDGHWADRTTYADGCCNNLVLQPDVGGVGIGIQEAPNAKLEIGGSNAAGETRMIFSTNSSPKSNRFFIKTDLDVSSNNDILEFSSTNVGNIIVLKGDGKVGIGAAPSSYQLQLSTDSAGKPNGGSWANSSDERLKTNIKPVKDALAKITKLQPILFDWRNPLLHGNAVSSGGFAAQQIAEVFPEFVTDVPCAGADCSLTDNGKVKSLTLPFTFDAYLVGAVKEQQTEIDALKSENAGLKIEINSLKARIDALEKK
ncbi:MAG: tail fiber domain-containing protein [Candidatus Liptonbacteria bacterium]|nr:tail fiber domain-containing protein [Candidatus Liptonbacteria bacterium]